MPTPVSDDKVSLLSLFAELIAFQLEAEEDHARSRAALLDANQTAEVREQFIAVLGHDLRNPLAAITMSSDQLQYGFPETVARVGRRIRSSADRIARMVDDLLDFARGRLGGGLPLDLVSVEAPIRILRQVVDELAISWPDREIRFTAQGEGAVRCDAQRLGQAMSNLVGNALQHSPGDTPVDIAVTLSEGSLEVVVTNRGPPIPHPLLATLFQPYRRAPDEGPRAGLGLGLYIVSQIVRGHGGTIGVRSTDEGTAFTMRLPRNEVRGLA